MYLLVLGFAFLIILIEISYVRLGNRKKIIDQFESDVRIFLVLILIASLYALFFSISFLYLKFFIATREVKWILFSLYFLVPPFLGVLLYSISPLLCGRNLNLTDTTAPDTVYEVSRFLGLSTFPEVKSSPFQVSPLVYGRRGRHSTFVLPDMSFLTEEEQKAVITHELSHIRQGDVGFFTWLSLLTKGLMYWIIPFPLVAYFQSAYYYTGNLENAAFVVLILLFLVSVVLLKNSLLRTRESIADAYAVFHGFGTPLTSALYKYAALRTPQRGGLQFFRESPVPKSLLGIHPPLQRRLHDIEKKAYLTETITNLSCELALWTGLASAFLFYSLFHAVINFSVTFDLPLMSDSVSFIFSAILFLATANVVAASYVFPVTKESVLFLDLSDPEFLVPLLRNLVITAATAIIISYGLSFDMQYTRPVAAAVLGGFLLSIVGFSGARRTDFSHGEQYLVLVPVVWLSLLWYPLKTIYMIFSRSPDMLPFLISMLSIMVCALGIILILMEKGQLLMTRKDRILMFLGKKWEFPRTNDFIFIFLVLIILIVPAVISFAVYVISCLFDMTGIVFLNNIFMYSLIAVLLIYGLRRSDILYFHKLFYLLEIILMETDIGKEDTEFIQKVIETYQSSDGGFDYAGVGFSNQKDTFYFVKAAKTLGIPLDDKRIAEWIASTENETGGFALFPGGCPRVEGLYYAVQSLSSLGLAGEMHHRKWILDSFKGDYFDFESDTDSRLIQTCYAVELLNSSGKKEGGFELDPCRKWIEAHFLRDLTPREAYFGVRALKILDSDMKVAEKWVDRNVKVLSTRVDKNLEDIYYYVKVLRELKKVVFSFIVEQAVRELAETRKEYKGRFG